MIDSMHAHLKVEIDGIMKILLMILLILSLLSGISLVKQLG